MLFDLYDSDADNSLTLNELCKLLEEIGNKITALPAVSYRGSLILVSPWLISLFYRRRRSLLSKVDISDGNSASLRCSTRSWKRTTSRIWTKPSAGRSDTNTLGVWRILAMPLCLIWDSSRSWAAWSPCMLGEVYTGVNRCPPGQGHCS